MIKCFPFFLSIQGNRIVQKLLEQIEYLEIDINNEPASSSPETLLAIFTLLLSLCKRLIKLNFGYFFHRLPRCTFHLSSTGLNCSGLSSLKIKVETFDDCLYLLERLNCLSKLIISVKIISSISGIIDNTVSLFVYFSHLKREEKN